MLTMFSHPKFPSRRPAARSFSVDATIEVSSPKSQSETALGSKNIPDKIVFDGEVRNETIGQKMVSR